MKKILRGPFLTVILSLPAFYTFSQASGSANFTFEVKFEADIPLNNIELSYFPKGGNHFEKINYTADTVQHKLLIYGSNHFVLHVTFPTLVFSIKTKAISPYSQKEIDVTDNYYLISEGPLTALWNTPKALKFTKEAPNIILNQIQLGQDYTSRNETRYILNQGLDMNINQLIRIEKDILKR